ncbi:hypothetical protein [Denitrobaculum tricleocarpae]|uniref:Uncharacterized protein n=1 Tax=Denitrobaculum tricleocarpae TaxID=2591009 RepID=A0A545U312_9PROT|nr:hypothetical protein [Denitrobaculum tricleocarpae]TQV83803.1 hypothetical protein FKG95_04275 [Denitrobaculum tricleocarpae]
MTGMTHLPPPDSLERLFQSLALLDAIMSPEWEYRYYSFDAHWGPGETMGSMRNGSGDSLFALFNDHGCFLKGFSHEHQADHLGAEAFYKHVPEDFAVGVVEPAFSPNNVTFCYWRRRNDGEWNDSGVELSKGDDPDGSAFLLLGLDGKPETYQAFACEYYEAEVPLDPVAAIFAHGRLTEDIVRALNPEISIERLQADIAEIGYGV